MRQSADPHLPRGLLALRAGLIRGDQLVDAFRAWLVDDSRPIDDHLVAMGCLDEAQRADLAARAEVAASTESDPEADPDRTRSCPAPASSGPAVEPGPTPGAGRYRILRRHAEGGLGVVYVALDSELNREVALKRIREDHADDPGSRGRFLIEAEITGRLEHPGIVPVHGLGRQGDGRPFYAMRLVRGASLRQAIEAFHEGPTSGPDGSLAFRRLLKKFTDVCEAIEYAHSRGVIHRDIKPGNVIVGKHGETLVLDWGLARATGVSEPGSPEGALSTSSGGDGSATIPGQAMGTPAYMSPEQARGELEGLGPRSDVYSLGATLYCLLTGRAPFEGPPSDVLVAVRAGDFPPPRAIDASIDPALEAVVLKAMAADPASRYPSAKALAEDVERWLADERVEAYPEPWTRGLIRWLTRHRVSVTAAGAAGLVAIAALGVLVASQSRANARLAAINLELDLQRERAEANESEAIDAVKRFNDAIIANPELRFNPTLGPLREALLREPLSFFGRLRDRLQSEAAPRPETLFRLADAIGAHAILTDQIGDKEEAIRTFRQSADILERLAVVRPDVLGHHAGLASALTYLGGLMGNAGRVDEARAALFRALEIGERLAGEQPEIVGHRALLLRGRVDLGALLARTGSVDEALAALAGAIEVGERLAGEQPDVVFHRANLSTAYDILGVLLIDAGRVDEALKANGRAIELAESLAREHAACACYDAQMARVRINSGTVLSAAGRVDDARRAFERAVELGERVARAQPAVAASQAFLATSHRNLGLHYLKGGRVAEGVEAVERAAEIGERLARDHPDVPEYRAELAAARDALGWQFLIAARVDDARRCFERAIEIGERLARDQPGVVGHHAALAKAHFGLASLLNGSGRADDALPAFGRAIEIGERLARDHPDVVAHHALLANCHANLGVLHAVSGRVDKARACLEQAEETFRRLARDQPGSPDFASALGAILLNLAGCDIHSARLDEARERMLESGSWHRKALAASPANPPILTARERQLQALLLLEQERGDTEGFARAQRELAEFRRDDPRPAVADPELKGVLEGKAPKDAAERLKLGLRAYQTRRFALAARLWGEALDAEPGLAEDRRTLHAYNAACAAVLAADGKGVDPPADHSEKVRLRGRALAWLKSEADVWSRLLGSGPPESREEISKVLRHWQGDPDLASIRDADRLAGLPEDERAAWEALWSGVDELMKKAE
ncbi:protein kinase [Paludisphaera sp.]|uniref:protein kinase domain-containing protein n=1 Tax=Paludisphaera sp. TaxID=2017432 RepID=UPI00301C7721